MAVKLPFIPTTRQHCDLGRSPLPLCPSSGRRGYSSNLSAARGLHEALPGKHLAQGLTGPEASVSGGYYCYWCLVWGVSPVCVDTRMSHRETGRGLLGTWTPGKDSSWGGDSVKGEDRPHHPLLIGVTAGGMGRWWSLNVG